MGKWKFKRRKQGNKQEFKSIYRPKSKILELEINRWETKDERKSKQCKANINYGRDVQKKIKGIKII